MAFAAIAAAVAALVWFHAYITLLVLVGWLLIGILVALGLGLLITLYPPAEPPDYPQRNWDDGGL